MALATPGIELILGTTVTAVEKHNGLITGVTLHSLKGQQRTITTSLTVGADGRNSIVARLAGIPARRRENNRFGYFAYYRNLHLPTGVTRQMWFCDPDMGYMFATDEDLTLAACILTRDKLKYFKQDLEKAFTSFFADLPNVPTLQNAERVSKILGKIDMPLLYRQASKPGLALVGDAALSTDPLWGVGIGWAFQSAQWLVDATAESLSNPARLDKALKRYRNNHLKRLAAHHFFIIANYANGRRHNTFERAVFAAAARDPQTSIALDRLATRSSGASYAVASILTHTTTSYIRYKREQHTPRLKFWDTKKGEPIR